MQSKQLMILLWLLGVVTIAVTIAISGILFIIAVPLVIGTVLYLLYKGQNYDS